MQNYLVVELNSDNYEKATITMHDALGHIVFAVGQLAKGFNYIVLNQVQQRARGTYILTLHTPANVFHSKFVKREH